MVLQIILADILLIARILPRPCGARKNTTQLVKYPHQEEAPDPHILSVKPSNTLYVFLPNSTILVHFGGISGEFGRAMARPNEPDMSPRCTKMVRLGIFRTQISLNFHYLTRISSHEHVGQSICFYISDPFGSSVSSKRTHFGQCFLSFLPG